MSDAHPLDLAGGSLETEPESCGQDRRQRVARKHHHQFRAGRIDLSVVQIDEPALLLVCPVGHQILTPETTSTANATDSTTPKAIPNLSSQGIITPAPDNQGRDAGTESLSIRRGPMDSTHRRRRS